MVIHERQLGSIKLPFTSKHIPQSGGVQTETPHTSRDWIRDTKIGRGIAKASTALTVSLTALGAFKSSDLLLTQALNPPTPPAIVKLDTNTPPSKIHEATFVFPPYQAKSAYTDAASLKSVFGREGLVFSITLPNPAPGEPLDMHPVAEAENRTIKEYHLKIVNEVGISTGGNEEDAVLPDLNLGLNGGVKIGDLYYVGTPITWSDVRDKRKGVPLFLNTINPLQGIYEKFIQESVGTMINTNPGPDTGPLCGSEQLSLNPLRRLRQTIDLTLNSQNASSQLSTDELIMDNGTLLKTAEELSTVRPRRLIYIGSSLDTVVNDKTAAQHLSQANDISTILRSPDSGRLSARFPLKATPVIEDTIINADHASLKKHQEAYNRAFSASSENHHSRHHVVVYHMRPRKHRSHHPDKYIISNDQVYLSLSTANPPVNNKERNSCPMSVVFSH